MDRHRVGGNALDVRSRGDGAFARSTGTPEGATVASLGLVLDFRVTWGAEASRHHNQVER